MTAVDPALALARLPATRWREVGAALRRAGLTERAVLACFGVRAVAHVLRAIGAGRRFDAAPPPAAVLPWLLVGGGTVARAPARRAASATPSTPSRPPAWWSRRRPRAPTTMTTTRTPARRGCAPPSRSCRPAPTRWRCAIAPTATTPAR
ncbi:MAG: hypothetical protein H6708_19880 [Kofleriaceae bacterium]|nr:hypothetical protein [Kofleriaceae bacterium]